MSASSSTHKKSKQNDASPEEQQPTVVVKQESKDAPDGPPYSKGFVVDWGKRRDRRQLLRNYCSSCMKDITEHTFIACADPQCTGTSSTGDGAILLCLPCFSYGAEANNPRLVSFTQPDEMMNHKKTHQYRVVYPVAGPGFEPHWEMGEEQRLLESVRQFGFGNWKVVASAVGNKSIEQVIEHYEKIYVKGTSAPQLTDPNWMRPHRTTKIPKIASRPYDEKYDHYYMPKRHAFHVEWFPELDSVIEDVEFFPTDTPEETALKQKAVALYLVWLEERDKKTDFIVDNKLLERFNARPSLDAKTKEMCVLLQVLTRQEYESMCNEFLKEDKLRKEIRKYQSWRQRGITQQHEGDSYEAQKRKRLRSAPVEDTQSSRLLNQSELNFVAQLKIDAKQYTAIKECFIREFCRSGSLTERVAKKLVRAKVAPNIFAFLQAQGFINIKGF